MKTYYDIWAKVSGLMYYVTSKYLLIFFFDKILSITWTLYLMLKNKFNHLNRVLDKNTNVWLTVLNDLIANRLAIIVEKPGARQLCAINPSFSSAKHMTSSPCFQSHEGIFNRYAYTRKAKIIVSLALILYTNFEHHCIITFFKECEI